MDAKKIRALIEDYSEESGLMISTVCQHIFRDAHRYDRLGSQIEKNEKTHKKLIEYVEQQNSTASRNLARSKD